MKKILALVLAMIMVLSMGVAFAESEQETATTPSIKVVNKEYKDVASVTLSKIYKLDGVSGVSPEEEFKFTINTWKVTDNSVANFPQSLPTVSTVKYDSTTGGAAGDKGNNQNITISLPTYSATGAYYYVIEETNNGVAGVTYLQNPIVMKVVVLQGDTGYVRIPLFYSATETTTDDGTTYTLEGKIDSITNTYTAGQLEVTKNVTGGLGDKGYKFAFTLKFTSTKEVKSSMTVVGGAISGSGWTKVTDDEGNSHWELTVTATLKNGEYVVVSNIPSDVKYSVVETEAGQNGYTTTYSVGDQTVKIDSSTDPEKTPNQFTGEIKASKVTMTVNNDKPDGNITTGVLVDNAPYMIIMALVLVGAAMMLKRRAYND